MAKVIILPKLGFTQEDGKVMEWHKQVGEQVVKGEPFFDVHTDKTVVTIDAAESGTLLKIVAETGVTLPVFTPIAVVGEPGEDADAALAAHVMDVAPDQEVEASYDDSQQEEEEPPKAPQADVASLKLTPKARRLIQEESYDMDSVAQIKGSGFQDGITAKDIRISPLARKLAEKTGVDPQTVSGSGPQGKIVKADVEKAASRPAVQKDGMPRILETVPYDGVRRVIGQRLSESKFSAPHMYFTDSVDTTALSRFRHQLNEEGEVHASMSDLLIMAASKALKKFPGINSSLLNDQIVTYESTNVGLAVAGKQGLIVPVVKDVQEKTLSQVAEESRELIARAREGRLSPSEYSGGTFTISNLGMFGIENFTAIINPPEAAILAVSSIRKTPVVITNEQGEDEVAIRPMMKIQLSADHRIVDGLLAAQFVAYFKELLETPIKILL